jgi:hypothetical protein
MRRFTSTLLVGALLAAIGVACGDPSDDDAPRGGGGDMTCATGKRCATGETPTESPTPHTPGPSATVPVATTTAVAAAPTATAGPAAQTGTLEGTVHIGPTCPVVREGEDCDDRPYEADLDIVDGGGGLVTTVRSDVNGNFSATLAPGAYTLVPRSDGVLPYAGEQQFTIEAGRVTQVDVAYDSGIR